jgi:hypothetical protein
VSQKRASPTFLHVHFDAITRRQSIANRFRVSIPISRAGIYPGAGVFTKDNLDITVGIYSTIRGRVSVNRPVRDCVDRRSTVSIKRIRVAGAAPAAEVEHCAASDRINGLVNGAVGGIGSRPGNARQRIAISIDPIEAPIPDSGGSVVLRAVQPIVWQAGADRVGYRGREVVVTGAGGEAGSLYISSSGAQRRTAVADRPGGWTVKSAAGLPPYATTRDQERR